MTLDTPQAFQDVCGVSRQYGITGDGVGTGLEALYTHSKVGTLRYITLRDMITLHYVTLCYVTWTILYYVVLLERCVLFSLIFVCPNMCFFVWFFVWFGSVCRSVNQATIRDFFDQTIGIPSMHIEEPTGHFATMARQIVIVFLTLIIWTLCAAIYEANAPPAEKDIGPGQPPNPSCYCCCCCCNSSNVRRLEKNGEKKGNTDKDDSDGTDTTSNPNNNNKSKVELAEIEAEVEEDEETLLDRNIPRSSSGV
jgi:hypothetical protein